MCQKDVSQTKVSVTRAASEALALMNNGMSSSDAIARVSRVYGGMDWDELYEEMVDFSGVDGSA